MVASDGPLLPMQLPSTTQDKLKCKTLVVYIMRVRARTLEGACALETHCNYLVTGSIRKTWAKTETKRKKLAALH